VASGLFYKAWSQIRIPPYQIKKENIPKTSFRTHAHYDLLVTPFGLINAHILESLINKFFCTHLRKIVLILFDDIVIYRKSSEEHIKYVDRVLQIHENNHLCEKISNLLLGNKK